VVPPPDAVAGALAEGVRRVLPDSPFAGESRSAAELYEVMFTKFAAGIRDADGFGAPERWTFAWERTYTRDEWLDLLPTTGGLTRLAPEALADVLAGVGAAIDALGGGFALSYTTLAVVARKS
jgi:hypothetical protein